MTKLLQYIGYPQYFGIPDQISYLTVIYVKNKYLIPRKIEILKFLFSCNIQLPVSFLKIIKSIDANFNCSVWPTLIAYNTTQICGHF